jgi:PII-like signaling protein
MKGFQITFFTQQDRKYLGKPLGEWLLACARQLGAQNATLTAAGESVDSQGRLHSAHFFELADQPVAVALAVDEATAERLFAMLANEDISVFYVKTAVEFGSLGRAAS